MTVEVAVSDDEADRVAEPVGTAATATRNPAELDAAGLIEAVLVPVEPDAVSACWVTCTSEVALPVVTDSCETSVIPDGAVNAATDAEVRLLVSIPISRLSEKTAVAAGRTSDVVPVNTDVDPITSIGPFRLAPVIRPICRVQRAEP